MSTNNNGKVNIKILIPVVILIVISIFAYIFLKQGPVQTQEERIEKVKQDLVSLIPGKYQVIESEYEEPSEENNGCVYIFSIRPKEYSETDQKYLYDAGIMYCEDINSAILSGQVDQVTYNQEEDKWFYQETEPLETKEYGNNIVSMVSLGGSHALSDFYIVRLDNTDELIILVIPNSNRIRCDVYDEEGVESLNEDCVAFRDSLSPTDGDWVPDGVYDNYYNDLLELLKQI